MNANNYSIREPGFEGLLIGVVQQAVDDYVFWNIRKQECEDLETQIKPLENELALFVESRNKVRKEVQRYRDLYDDAEVIAMYETIDKWTERIDSIRQTLFPMRKKLNRFRSIEKKAIDAEEFMTSDLFCETFSITKDKIMTMCNELVDELEDQNDE